MMRSCNIHNLRHPASSGMGKAPQETTHKIDRRKDATNLFLVHTLWDPTRQTTNNPCHISSPEIPEEMRKIFVLQSSRLISYKDATYSAKKDALLSCTPGTTSEA